MLRDGSPICVNDVGKGINPKIPAGSQKNILLYFFPLNVAALYNRFGVVIDLSVTSQIIYRQGFTDAHRSSDIFVFAPPLENRIRFFFFSNPYFLSTLTHDYLDIFARWNLEGTDKCR